MSHIILILFRDSFVSRLKSTHRLKVDFLCRKSTYNEWWRVSIEISAVREIISVVINRKKGKKSVDHSRGSSSFSMLDLIMSKRGRDLKT
jgi:hypothetical protein